MQLTNCTAYKSKPGTHINGIRKFRKIKTSFLNKWQTKHNYAHQVNNYLLFVFQHFCALFSTDSTRITYLCTSQLYQQHLFVGWLEEHCKNQYYSQLHLELFATSLLFQGSQHGSQTTDWVSYVFLALGDDCIGSSFHQVTPCNSSCVS